MATMYMVNLLSKLQKSEEKGKHIPSRISTILITDEHIWHVCVSLQLISSKLPFYLIFGYMVAMTTIYKVNFMRKMRKMIVSPSLISTILITVSEIWYVCTGLYLISSQMLLYLIFG